MTEVTGRHGPEHVDYVLDRALSCVEAYTAMMGTLRKVAQQFGYALGLHGSLARDLDIIAVPWADEAVSAEVLVNALIEIIRSYNSGFALVDRDCPVDKPHGRKVWTIHGPIRESASFYIDLSVMPIVLT